MNKRWINSDTDLYVVSDPGIRRYVECASGLDITWTGDPMEEIGCWAQAEVEAPFALGGQVLASMENGERLELVKGYCGPRGRGDYGQEDLVLRLSRCAIRHKGSERLITCYPDDVTEPVVRLEVEGMLRFW